MDFFLENAKLLNPSWMLRKYGKQMAFLAFKGAYINVGVRRKLTWQKGTQEKLLSNN